MKRKTKLIASCGSDGSLKAGAECVDIMQGADGAVANDGAASDLATDASTDLAPDIAHDLADDERDVAAETEAGDREYISVAEAKRREHEAWLRGRNEKIEAEWLNPDLLNESGTMLPAEIPPGLFKTRPSVWE